MQITGPALITFSGPPGLGKTTLGRKVAELCGVRFVDHEIHCRVPFFGPGHPDPDAAPEVRQRFNIMQATAYDVLFAVVDAHLDLGLPIVVSATFVSERSQKTLASLAEKKVGTRFAAFFCWSNADTDEAVLERLAGRTFGRDYFGGVNDLKSYREQKARWKFGPMFPYLVLDTFTLSVDECVAEAIRYITARQ